MPQKISVLGCGWLGRPLALALKNKGFAVKGSNRKSEKSAALKALGIEPFVVDIAKDEIMPSDFLASQILIIAVPSKHVRDFERLIQQIINSTVRQIILISATSVYPDLNDIVDEQTPLPASPLVEIENLFRLNGHFETTIVRFAGLFGYDRQPGNFFPIGRKIPNPDGSVNMIHQDDCINLILALVEQSCWGQTLNACADAHPTRREFYTQEVLKVGKPSPEFDESKLSSFKIVSNKKIKRKLNYHFKHPDLMDEKDSSP